MDDTLTHVGIGGIFAILILREVFGFLKNSRAKLNGNSPITRNEFDKHKDAVQYRDNCGQIVKRIDGNFTSLKESQKQDREYQEKRFDAVDGHLSDIKAVVNTLK